MFSAFVFSVGLYWKLCRQSLSRSGGLGPVTLKGRLLRLLLYLLFAPVFLIHWLGFLLDEIFFRDYRKVAIKEPVFVLGVPRSGTTFLHRTLAADKKLFTSVSTWEVFLAPSISQRVFWRLLGRFDRLLGRPFGRLINHLEKRLFSGLEGIHDVSLQAAEEDYLLLLPLMSCFILFLPFTESSYIWNLSRLDWQMPEADRQRIMQFYRASLQKHLYFHGKELRYLSKNASFASWVQTLQKSFPDARFIVCLREPDKAVPSLLGSLASGAEFFELDLHSGRLPAQLVEMMQCFYQHLLTDWQPDWELVQMHELKSGIDGRIASLYRHLGLPMTREYQQELAVQAAQARQFTPRTRPIDPSAGMADVYFRERFPWYYRILEA